MEIFSHLVAWGFGEVFKVICYKSWQDPVPEDWRSTDRIPPSPADPGGAAEYDLSPWMGGSEPPDSSEQEHAMGALGSQFSRCCQK